MMPADYHTHRPATAERTEEPDETHQAITPPNRHATGISVALTVVAVLVIVAAVLGVFMWLAA
ncbi:MAG TPA: hypothetical protein VJ938_07825 [Acidimicrobiia bacterium]|nr:hypothetical protein [Acidimicrobiia bacterium]